MDRVKKKYKKYFYSLCYYKKKYGINKAACGVCHVNINNLSLMDLARRKVSNDALAKCQFSDLVINFTSFNKI